MIIDIIFAIVLLLAAWRGYRRGLIVGIFSFLAVFIGLAAALKLSAVVSSRLADKTKISAQWLPFLSFLLVFVAVLILVWLGAKALEKVTQAMMLGWLNRIGGILFFTAMYAMVFSVLLFFAEKMGWLKPSTIKDSIFYPVIQPWGPLAINAIGQLLPWFRNLFGQLESFFSSVATHAS